MFLSALHTNFVVFFLLLFLMDLVSNVFLFLRRNLLLGKRLNIFTSSADEDGIEPAAGIDGFRFSFLSFFSI